MDRVAFAQQALGAGFNCSVSVLSAFAEDHGLSLHDARRVAGAFGGGIAGSGGLCGAVTGGLMALGLATAKTEASDNVARDCCNAEANAFMAAFQHQCGSSQCRELLGADISDPAKLAEAREQGLFQSRCPRLVQVAVELVQAQLAAKKG